MSISHIQTHPVRLPFKNYRRSDSPVKKEFIEPYTFCFSSFVFLFLLTELEVFFVILTLMSSDIYHLTYTIHLQFVYARIPTYVYV